MSFAPISDRVTPGRAAVADLDDVVELAERCPETTTTTFGASSTITTEVLPPPPAPDGVDTATLRRTIVTGGGVPSTTSALTLLGERPEPNERCIDLGSSPGGWTWVLVRAGLRVHAIDNGPLREHVLATGQVTHLREDGFHWHPAQPLDWMVCDMVEQPIRVAERMAHRALGVEVGQGQDLEVGAEPLVAGVPDAGVVLGDVGEDPRQAQDPARAPDVGDGVDRLQIGERYDRVHGRPRIPVIVPMQ